MSIQVLVNWGIILGSALVFAVVLWVIAHAVPPQSRLYKAMQFVGTASAATAMGLIVILLFSFCYLSLGIITPSRP